MQTGGYTGDVSELPAILHAREVVLPLNNIGRTVELLNQYVTPTLAAHAPHSAHGGASQVTHKHELTVKVAHDSKYLTATIEKVSADQAYIAITRLDEAVIRQRDGT